MQIIVLAMHRSGTSAVARLLNMMGAYVGAEGTTTGANSENPKGFWERRDVRDVNDGLLFAANADWHRVGRFEIGDIPEEKRQAYETEARRIVLELEAHRPWVVKEPRFCLLLPFWLDLLESPVIVHVQRSPIQIAQSLQRRNGFPLHVGLALWERYTFDALRYSKDTPGIVVQHQDVIADPVAVVKKMHHDLRELGVTGLRLPDAREIRAFVEPALHRQRGDDTLQSQVMNEQQRSLSIIIQNPLSEVFSAIAAYQLSHGGNEALLGFQQALDYEEKLVAQRRHAADCEEKLAAERRTADAASRALAELKTLTRQNAKSSARAHKIAGSIEERAKKAQKLVGETRRSRRWRLGSAMLGGVREMLGYRPNTALDVLDKLLADLQAKAAKLHSTLASEPVADSTRASAEAVPQAEARQQLHWDSPGPALSEGARPGHARKRNNLLRSPEDADPAEQKAAIERLAQTSDVLIKDIGRSWRWRVGDVVVGVLTGARWRERRPQVALDALAVKVRQMEAVAKAAVDTALQTPVQRETIARIAETRIDVIVCVHNALDDVQRCLQSVLGNSPRLNRLILVDDASESDTRDFLINIADQTPNTLLLRNEQACGYTKAANMGLLSSIADFAVLLNSDTIVSRGWLERLWRCFAEDNRVGIVGPLSNAASWQSVPEQRNADGDWTINTLPEHVPVSAMAKLVANISTRTRPSVPILNGFCLMISRRVIDAVGVLDEKAFPRGYGEENDYCIRAGAAGFRLVLADDAYVYHAKSKSYSHTGRKVLAKAGRAALDAKYGAETIPRLSAELAGSHELREVRTRIAAALEAKPLAGNRLRMLYLLPVRPGGGGVHSVVQEAQGLRSLGVETRLAVPEKHLEQFWGAYPHRFHGLFARYSSTEQLVALAQEQDVVVATIFSSVTTMSKILEAHPHLLPAYYIQDYEPWICGQDTPARAQAARSYDAIPGMLRFAKTDWICKMVRERHAVNVHRVVASVDHSVYYPPRHAQTGDNNAPVRLCAMIRPRTVRRGAPMTMRVLKQLAERFGESIRIVIFGCTTDEIERAGLGSGFPYENHGVLSREQVADILRANDVFLDLSTYQAFGRTALEAMACRCAVVVPALGGAEEYAIDNVNARVVDTANEPEILSAVTAMVEDRELRSRLSDAGCKTASEYTINGACASIKAVVDQALKRSNVVPEQNAH
jgi:GT2 family glycosyltransferase/glycosyltransferase involved in cell wall biosynthesis